PTNQIYTSRHTLSLHDALPIERGIPEMRRRGYPDEIATGSICAGGTLGILIPPSITFILYGIATETSIGRLFLAGVMPGLLLTVLFMLWTLFTIWKRGFRAHEAD